ncbi:DNA methyltransferase [Priestia sp. TRN 1309]|uniref:DNA methyltransferase n=1 Tax=Priestia sp. TRN 1309 TaxID=3420729 RepID=UPI003D77D528
MNKETQQLSFLEEQTQADNNPIICLGMEFENDEVRQKYFRDELRKKLPELKQLKGFPKGEDEDIIALSDPPYYTACPNPWLNNFIKEWEREKVEKYGRENDEEYHCEPFASDVSEGKNDAVYNAHSYHTKVPYKAIMHYLLHYTRPGDIVLDGFSGTGMTGVAARRCGNEETIKSLGYTISDKKIINSSGEEVGEFGKRLTILNDLSPSATLITYNYNSVPDVQDFVKEAKRILELVKEECSWMYETVHQAGNNQYGNGKINYVVWSDVFQCPNCTNEITYWDVAVDAEEKKILSDFNCGHCGIELQKSKLERAWDSYYDKYLNDVITVAKQNPVYINYSVGTKRFERAVNEEDLKLIEKIKTDKIPYQFPLERMPAGDESRRNDRTGLTHSHHYYTHRNIFTLASFVNHAKQSKYFNRLLFFFQASVNRATKTNRFRFGGTGGLSGTLYIPSLIFERNVILLLEKKLKDYEKMLLEEKSKGYAAITSTQSTSKIESINENAVDYIFTDPPFGKNLMYSELNFLWECWLKLVTNNEDEAIMNNTQSKGLLEYQKLMEESFKSYFKVLKPGRWMTVEFSNSQASVWNAIQEAIQKAGFIIANVAALDKKQGSFKAVTTTTAVKQDLVISAYKPKKEDIDKMKQEQNTKESAWTFVAQHLEQLPTFIGLKGEAQVIPERTPRILFDRMVAYHVQNNLPVPISSADFQVGVAQRFPMRDGMIFLENQVAEYDKKRTLVKEFAQMNLFVSDENSAIEWIRQQLLKKPQKRQDLHPSYMKEIQHIAKHELLPELDDLLDQNFLRYEGDGIVPDQITSYLRKNYKDLRGLDSNDPALIEKAWSRWYVPDPNKQADLEKLREKALLREFDSYLEELEKSKKKLRQFRTEAIRYGFKKAYSEKDFEKIVKIGERLPESVIQEDDKLLMYYDNACIRLGL